MELEGLNPRNFLTRNTGLTFAMEAMAFGVMVPTLQCRPITALRITQIKIGLKCVKCVTIQVNVYHYYCTKYLSEPRDLKAW